MDTLDRISARMGRGAGVGNAVGAEVAGVCESVGELRSVP